MKYFVLSDIHGEYPAMMKGLKAARYNKKDSNHQIIVIGDYFGRASTGKGPYGIYKYLTSKTHKNKPICLLGNHEETFVRGMLTKGYVSLLDERNGEDETIYSFYANIPNIDNPDTMQPVYDELQKHPVIEDWEDRWSPAMDKDLVLAINMLGEGKQLLNWVNSLPYYYETKHYIFTHGWLPYTLKRKKNISNKVEDYENYDAFVKAVYKNSTMIYDYKKADSSRWHAWLWTKTPEDYEKHCLIYPKGWKKWIVVGHWHAFAFGPRSNFFQNAYWDKTDVKSEEYNYVVDKQHKVIFCDHCTVYGHKINVLVIDDEPLN